jgi:hypothetical protein
MKPRRIKVLALGQVGKVAKAINDTGGTSAEYQHIQLELRALERTLQCLQELEPDADNIPNFTSIRAVALACRIPLQQFLDKIQCFEATMGPFSRPGKSLNSAARKTQWAVFLRSEVDKIRAVVTPKVLNLNLLLYTNIS